MQVVFILQLFPISEEICICNLGGCPIEAHSIDRPLRTKKGTPRTFAGLSQQPALSEDQNREMQGVLH